MTGPAPTSWAVDPDAAGARLVVPGVWRLRLPLAWPGVDHVNAYAIERDDGIMLVDTGSAGHPTCLAALETALAQAGYGVPDVRVVAATHGHSDHVGLAAHLVRHAGAEVWAHPATDASFFDIVREPDRFHAARERRARREGVPEERLFAVATAEEEVQATLAPVAVDHVLVDGVRLPSALGDWEVVETPGHAASHVCLVQREHRLVCAGDLVCFAFSPWLDYGFSADPTTEILASLDRIQALGPMAWALPGHGRPLPDLGAVIDEHRQQFARRIEEVRDAVTDVPTGAYALTTHLCPDVPDRWLAGQFSEVLAHLAHLRHRGEVVREEAADGSYGYRSAAEGGPPAP
ncbi:MBL fold metallo-hydrolase [Baekduia soli]|uniref:MBL fold metallo-hydrolase n=1 Tax=Baekduia soli TaxID=496014 RepID=A0A5B8UC02_9ACTN|nr:MBL fold metallo-hydrolase [Baekduia soli]QEC50514.1 MBL fold metallo-hydrolase [Baekduia soli]